uniref:Uncharacterized protein n=1 Tax=Kalanchoe fedtschenkoi TaxID=63787 RepID=A0A7N0UQ14_KALFE
MGQAFRRASGRIQSSSLESTSKVKNTGEQRPPVAVKLDKLEVPGSEDNANVESEGMPKVNPDNVLEERDPQYDMMLNQMVGRIKAKPGGKLEMGEAFVVEKYNRPMPKLRNTTTDSSRYEERPAPAGTLNVAQLRHILLLHQGKAEDHDGPMDIPQIASKFRVDTVQIQNILLSISLPPESTKQKNNSQ